MNSKLPIDTTDKLYDERESERGQIHEKQTEKHCSDSAYVPAMYNRIKSFHSCN